MKEKLVRNKIHKLMKACCFVFITSIIFAFALEVFVFTYRTKANFIGTEISLLDNPEYGMTTLGYDIGDNNHYDAITDDPNIFFSNINQNVQSILVTFSERVFDVDSYIQVFYCSGDEVFTAENSTSHTKIPFGASKIILNIPKAEYSGLRIDIDGSFSLDNIKVSDHIIEIERVEDVNINWGRILFVFIGIVIVTLIMLYYVFSEKNQYSLNKKEILFCCLCFIFYLVWASVKPYNYAPDEAMRYQVTLFLFKHNRLPVGTELLSPWGFSYAHSPAVLCNLLGYVFMKVAALFTSNEFLLLIATRMVSVCCATWVIYFVIKTAKQLFEGPARWIMVVLIAFIPQFCFLASYVNNDMVAFLGVSMILYAWTLGIKYNWNYKNASLLSVGISICALAYYNSYAWILMSVFLFFISYFYKNKGDYKQLRRLTVYIVCLTFVLIAYFFLRHLVLYGDLFGLSTSRKYGELYGIESLKPSVRLSLSQRGVSLREMLGEKYHWAEISYTSFIGNFGCMQYRLSSWIYSLYTLFWCGGVIGIIIRIIKYLYAKPKRINLSQNVMYICMLFCIAITIALSIYNSFCSDFQPQGRYCYPALPAIAVFMTMGYDTLLGFVAKKEHRYAVVSSMVTIMVCIIIYTFVKVYIPT